jgi:hypothetical protein
MYINIVICLFMYIWVIIEGITGNLVVKIESLTVSFVLNFIVMKIDLAIGFEVLKAILDQINFRKIEVIEVAIAIII